MNVGIRSSPLALLGAAAFGSSRRMRASRISFLAVAGQIQAATSWSGKSGVFDATRNPRQTRWTAPSTRISAWSWGTAKVARCGKPTASTVMVPRPTSLVLKATDTEVDVEVDLSEGEELLGTVDVSPEEIAEFFAQPM